MCPLLTKAYAVAAAYLQGCQCECQPVAGLNADDTRVPNLVARLTARELKKIFSLCHYFASQHKRTHSNPFTSQQKESRKLKIKCLADRSSQHQNRSIYLRYNRVLCPCAMNYRISRAVKMIGSV